MSIRRHITFKIGINCSASFDATVITLYEIVLDNKINNGPRRSLGNVEAIGISQISLDLVGDSMFLSQDPAP